MNHGSVATDFNPYRILNVEPFADQAAIDAAYEGLGDAEDGRRLEIETAYRILSDPGQRAAYDERLREALAHPPFVNVEGLLGSAQVGDGTPGPAPWTIADMAKAIAVVIGSLVVIGLPIAVLAAVIAGGDDIESDPNALALSLGANLVIEFAMVGVAYWFAVRKYSLSWDALGLRKPRRGRILLTIGLIVGAFVIIAAWGVLLQLLGIQPDTDLPKEAFDDWRPLAAVVILAVFIAPVAEEIFFRGFIFGGLLPRWGLLLGMLGSGALFSLAHLGNPGYIVVLPAIVGIGMLFAWGYYFSGSIIPSIVAHFTFNLVSIVFSIAAET